MNKDMQSELKMLIQNIKEVADWADDFKERAEREVAKSAQDSALKPNHYANGKFELFDLMEAIFPKEQVVGFYKLNAIKYLTRYQKKNGIEDLEKAMVYIQRLIDFEKHGVKVEKV